MTRARVAAALLAGLTLAAYAGAYRAAFVWDDRPLILNNRYVTEAQPWQSYWTRPTLIAGQGLRGFRPLTLASFAANYRMGGPNRAVFHLTSVGIHLLAVWGLWHLIRRASLWTSPGTPAVETAAVLCAGLFAVHPAMSQAVLFLTARSTLIAGAGILWAAVAYARALDPVAQGGRVDWRFYLAAVACWIIALSGKESALAGAGIFVLIEWWAVVRHAPRDRAARAVARLMIFACIGVAYLAWVFTVVRAMETTPPARTYGAHLVGQLGAAAEYARLFLWPTGLALDHGAEHLADVWSLKTVLGVGVLGVLLGAAWRTRARQPAVAFGIAAALVVIGPEAYAVPLRIVVNEHRLYLPGACLAVALAPAVAWMVARRPGPGIAVGGFVLFAAAAATMLRVSDWTSPERLWRTAHDTYPEGCRAPAHLGQLVLEAGDPGRAIMYLESATACDPARREPRLLLSTAYSHSGQHAKAIRHAERFVAESSMDSEAYSTLGTVLARAGRLAEAVPQWELALALDPHNGAAAENLANAGIIPLTDGR